jgi:hypothetical protein
MAGHQILADSNPFIFEDLERKEEAAEKLYAKH